MYYLKKIQQITTKAYYGARAHGGVKDCSNEMFCTRTCQHAAYLIN